MPYKQETTGNSNLPFFYNVEQAVGNNSPNATNDVKLVQYLLAGYYGPGSLKVDGWIGPVTIGWIKRFQEEVNRKGNNVLADGRVDRAFAYTSSVSKTVYTIILLNAFCKAKNPAAYNRLPASVPVSPNPRANPYNPARGPVIENDCPPSVDNNGTRIIYQQSYKTASGAILVSYRSDGSVTVRSVRAPAQYMY
ncbi:MAG: hypothetical protein HXY18_04500 [Bryobacteraceae bacterium]|nr:hypothetical protein [Bryobacteraceae bacterium]